MCFYRFMIICKHPSTNVCECYMSDCMHKYINIHLITKSFSASRTEE